MKENTDGLRLLTTADTDAKLMIVKALLEDNSIPFVIKDIESGDFMRILFGFSAFGANVFVSEQDHEKAKELIDVYTSGSGSDADSFGGADSLEISDSPSGGPEGSSSDDSESSPDA